MDVVPVTELDGLLEQVGKRGFLFWSFRTDLHGPEVVAAVFDWGGVDWDPVTDVVILFAEDHAVAYRTPNGPGMDVFTPQHVVWMYGGGPVWTLRALLTLAPPGHPDAPRTLINAPGGLRLPPADQLRVRIRRRGWH